MIFVDSDAAAWLVRSQWLRVVNPSPGNESAGVAVAESGNMPPVAAVRYLPHSRDGRDHQSSSIHAPAGEEAVIVVQSDDGRSFNAIHQLLGLDMDADVKLPSSKFRVIRVQNDGYQPGSLWPWLMLLSSPVQLMLMPTMPRIPCLKSDNTVSDDGAKVAFAQCIAGLLNSRGFRSVNICARGQQAMAVGQHLGELVHDGGGQDAWVVVLDRTCDVIAASCHSENIMDMVFNSLDSDGVMPMTSSDTDTAVSGQSFGGCSTVDVADPAVVALLNELAPATDKDALMILRRRIHECLQEADVKVPKQLGKVTPNQLLKLVSLLTPDIHSRYPGLMDMLICVAETLQKSTVLQWSESLAIEKILLATSRELSSSSAADFSDIFQQLSSILSREKVMDMEKFQRFILLLVYTYAVVGQSMRETDEETLLMNALLKTILIMPPADLGLLFELNSERDVLPQLEEFLQHLFRQLRHLASLQSQHFISDQSAGYKSFASVVAEKLYANETPESVGLVQIPAGNNLVSQAITDVSRRMWNASGMKNTATLVLCMVGGVTWDEVKDIANYATVHGKKITIVSSHISVHNDIIQQLI